MQPVTMNTTSIVYGRLNQRHLNFDILVYVGQWITERNDLLSYISTCSDLYRTGVPTLLGFHCRITRRNLAAFHAFLVSKSPSSFLGLRSLDLQFPQYIRRHEPIDKIGSNEIIMVTDILNRAKRIQSLNIQGSVMESDPMVYRALATLPALKVLNLCHSHDPRVEILAVLAQLPSPLVNLSFGSRDEPEDIVAALSNFHHSLECLALSSVTLAESVPSKFRYSNVTRLELFYVSNMQLSILIPAFPNLKHLVVKYAEQFAEPGDTPLRAENLQFQDEHPRDVWCLSSLDGDASSLYILGLQTTVPTVSIGCVGVRGHVEEEAISLLEAILTPLRPISLSIMSTDDFEESMYQIGWLSSDLIHDYCRFVRLDLDLTFDDAKPIHENVEQLEILFQQLTLVSASNPALFFLCVTLNIEAPLPQNEEHPSVSFADHLDTKLLATSALLAIPTLHMARFSICAEANNEETDSYWIYKADNELVEIPVETHALAEHVLNEETKAFIEAYISMGQVQTD